MASNQQQSREELDARARQGETVVPGGTGGKSLEAQEHLAEGKAFKLLDDIILWLLYGRCVLIWFFK